MKQFYIILFSALLLIFSLTAAQDGEKYFDQPVNPEIYMIRTGDQLLVTFVDSNIDSLILNINTEGKIVNRTLGVFDLSGLTLKQAITDLKQALMKYYNVEAIEINITRPRDVKINLTGAVRRPGVYTGFTSDRVSDIIKKGGGVLSDGSRRRIVFSGGSRDIEVDLDKAVYLGDLTSDPCLYAGYHIIVPGKSHDFVQVIGEVNKPREVELVTGDNIDLMIAFAGGFSSWADPDYINVLKSDNSNGSVEKLSPGDIIIVPPRERSDRENQIALFGAVNNPGYYSFENKSFNDLVKAGGGYTEDANINLTTVFRRSRFDVTGKVSNIRYPISNIFSESTSSSTFALIKSDSVFVPVKVGYVIIQGEVYNPGYYPHIVGQSAQDYIDNAGGFLPTAEKSEIGLYNPISKMVVNSALQTVISDGYKITVRKREELK